MSIKTVKLFEIGGHQAVPLPADCRFTGDEVYVKRVGDAVVLLPKGRAWRRWCRRRGCT